MKEIYFDTKLQQKTNFGKSKVDIHSSKKTINGTNNNCSFAIFMFFCFVFTMSSLYKHSISSSIFTFLFAINMNKIYFNTNLQQKITKYHFLKKIEKTTVVVFLEVKGFDRHLF